jgi:peptide methionine sulfoxide reductase MsrB
VLEESECAWPSAEMMVREPVVAKKKDHQSRRHHHYLGLAVKEDP